MHEITKFTNNISDLSDALNGSWGRTIKTDYSIVYLGTIVIAQGELDTIKQNVEKEITNWISIGENLYLGFIQ